MNDALMQLASSLPVPAIQVAASKWLSASSVQPIWMKVFLGGYILFWTRWYFRQIFNFAPNLHQDLYLKLFYCVAMGSFTLLGLLLGNRVRSVPFVAGLPELIYSTHAFTIALVFTLCFTFFRFLRPVNSRRLGRRHLWMFLILFFLATDALGPGASVQIVQQVLSDLSLAPKLALQ